MVPNVHAAFTNQGTLKPEFQDSYYSWWDDEKQKFLFTAPNLHCVEVCFPYGSDAEAKLGKGNVYKVKIEILGEVERG